MVLATEIQYIYLGAHAIRINDGFLAFSGGGGRGWVVGGW